MKNKKSGFSTAEKKLEWCAKHKKMHDDDDAGGGEWADNKPLCPGCELNIGYENGLEDGKGIEFRSQAIFRKMDHKLTAAQRNKLSAISKSGPGNVTKEEFSWLINRVLAAFNWAEWIEQKRNENGFVVVNDRMCNKLAGHVLGLLVQENNSSKKHIE